MSRVIDLTGQRFGRLTVVQFYQRKNGRTFWKCQCTCGNQTISRADALKSGSVKSCGCFAKEKHKLDFEKFARSKRQKNDLKENTDLTNLVDKPQSNSLSGIRGVCFSKGEQLWIATLNLKGKNILHKRFKNKQDAINARKEAEEKYFKPILEKYKNSHSRQSD